MNRLTSSLLTIAVTFGASFAGLVEASANDQSLTTRRLQSSNGLTVLSQDLLLNDKNRGKTLPVKVSFPQEAGTYPVIIYSHGARGSKNNYQPLIKCWVSHGYVCIQPTHSESLSLTREGGATPGATTQQNDDLRSRLRERIASMRASGSAGSGGRLSQGNVAIGQRSLEPGAFKDWRNRPLDVSFIIDNLQTLEKEVAGLKGKMDKSTIGVGGHSFGAHTSQLLGGTKIGGTADLEDSRPLAFLLISPQGRESGFDKSAALDKDSWSEFKRPMMVITGTNDTGRNDQSYVWRKDPYEFSPKGDKYLLVIDGAYHHFGGIAGVRRAHMKGPEDPNQVDLVSKTSLLFWDSYLKRDDSAQRTLKSKSLPQTESLKFTFATK